MEKAINRGGFTGEGGEDGAEGRKGRGRGKTERVRVG